MTTFRQFVASYRACSLLQNDAGQPEKFRYACKKFLSKNKSVAEGYDEAIVDLRVDHAVTDKDGILLKDKAGQYQYTKDGMKALSKSIKELNEKSVDFTPYLSADLPKGLSEIDAEFLVSFVISEEQFAVLFKEGCV